MVVTHTFLIAWFVRHALDAPERRWLGFNAHNGGLTVIRYRSGGRRPWSPSTTSPTCHRNCAPPACRGPQVLTCHPARTVAGLPPLWSPHRRRRPGRPASRRAGGTAGAKGW
ncbi:histidine phosphatase family protein [Micromonospora sp. NPDC047620]|uniref:histidine phosphatase family protein n=1 Tax=Micromonospora sp. NPDC047620 TaxID=3364251 RepID=UPI003723FC23